MENVNQENILIVDDAPENLRLLSEMLTKQGYMVRPATSGRLALSGAQAIKPDLILLDIDMPEMDGYETCRMLKTNKTTRDVPIIFISALNETHDKIKAFDLGGVDYIAKPFQVEEVQARVKTHLLLSRLQSQLTQQVEEERRLKEKLQQSLDKVKTLSGLIPICANCKKIRNDKGYWNILESYIEKHSEATFSHSICPKCSEDFYGHEDWYSEIKNK
jgi:PleD family two-component response regulator